MLVFFTTGQYTITDENGKVKTIETLDKDYKKYDNEAKKIYMLEEYGLPQNFMGGNVQMIYELKDSPILLLIKTLKGYEVYATGIKEEDAFDYLTKLESKTLRNLVHLYGIRPTSFATKEKIAEEFLEKIFKVAKVKA